MASSFCLRRMLSLACVLLVTLAAIATTNAAEAPREIVAADADIMVELLDTSDTESFLSVRLDTEGRLFVGGREALFVYEPNAQGGYEPRQELVRFPEHTWVYDIAIRGNDLYVTTVSALYKIEGARVKREGLKPERLVWGMPLGHVHQCMHALAWGPEGDLYFSSGDPLWNYGDFNRPDHWGHWVWYSQPAGTKTPYNGVGGVFRIRPDGSHLQAVTTGLRNSCGLAFDKHWNLFTNDNDHEQTPGAYVPGRLIHATPHAYFSWPRGWMLLKTPERKDLLQTMFDGLGRAVPVGQAYYDDPLLPARFRNNLLIARWDLRVVARYPLTPSGATFQVDEQRVLNGENMARPVGVAVGRGGRIFSTISYMVHNEGSPVYPSALVMITRGDDPAAHPFEPYDAVTAKPEKLFAELSNPAWSRRYDAQVEIQRRDGALLEEAERRLAQVKPNDPAIEHLIHLAAAKPDGKSNGKPLASLAQHAEPMIRLQAIRALGEYPALGQRDLFVKAIADRHPQVSHAAIVALFDRAGKLPTRELEVPARGDETYLRQAAVLLLAERAPLAELRRWCESPDARTRLAGTLAAGHKLTVPATFGPLPEGVPLGPSLGPVVQYADEKVDLRELATIGNYTMADLWNNTKHSADQETLFALLVSRLADKDEAVRMSAAQFLSLLRDERSEPGVVKVREQRIEERLAVSKAAAIPHVWLAGPFPDADQGFATIHKPELGPIDLAAKYGGPSGDIVWKKVEGAQLKDLNKLFAATDGMSFYVYFRLDSAARQRVDLEVGSDDGIKIWQNGAAVFTNDVMRSAVPFQDTVKLDAQPGSNDLLVRVRNRSGSCSLYLHYRSLEPVVAELPEPVADTSLAERLRSAVAGGQAAVPADFLTVDWIQGAAQGKADEGRKLFQSIGCAKCHAISLDATVVGGPSLAEARKRFTTDYLVESVLLPNKKVSPVFRATQIVTSGGKQYVGLVVGETAAEVDLLLPDTNRIKIPTADIEDRKLQDISPMPHGLVKKPDELRHLLAYLLSQ